MGRSVGARIRQVLELSDTYSGVKLSDLRVSMLGMPASNVCRYCARAEKMGLLVINRDKTPHTYRAVTGWRESIKRARMPKPAAVEAPTARGWGLANSVFARGQQ